MKIINPYEFLADLKYQVDQFYYKAKYVNWEAHSSEPYVELVECMGPIAN
jgi:hypothetical protein